jgi:hypothetical protein
VILLAAAAAAITANLKIKPIGVDLIEHLGNTTMKSLVSAMLLSLAIGAGSAFAQGAAPAPASQGGTVSAMTSSEKKAISKSCTDQANAKGLHGKARKKFRSDCKRAGGKTQ